MGARKKNIITDNNQIIYDKEEGPKSPILKFFSEAETKEMEARLEPKTGDIIFFSASDFEKAVSDLESSLFGTTTEDNNDDTMYYGDINQ